MFLFFKLVVNQKIAWWKFSLKKILVIHCTYDCNVTIENVIIFAWKIYFSKQFYMLEPTSIANYIWTDSYMNGNGYIYDRNGTLRIISSHLLMCVWQVKL